MRTISVAVMVATLGVSGFGLTEARARALANADEPAEFPPGSFKGSQYVDSRGCIYVRSGSGGVVHWVPRVTRDRKVLCGFKPTFANVEEQLPVIPDPAPETKQATKQAAAESIAQPQTTAPVASQPSGSRTVVQSAVQSTSRPAPAPVAAKVTAPKTPALPELQTYAGQAFGEPDCVAQMQNGQLRCSSGSTDYILKRLPAGVTVRTAGGGRMTTTEPTLVRVPVKTRRVAAAPSLKTPQAVGLPLQPALQNSTQINTAQVATTRVAATGQCAGLSGNAAQYLTANGRYAVRCGPQAVHPSAYVQKRTAAVLSTQSQNVAAVARAAGVDAYALPGPVRPGVPKGYEHAWTDGRLNPQRGPVTARGDWQMAQVWTQTTPAYDLYAPRKKTFWEWLFGSSFKSRNPAPVTVSAPQTGGQVYVSTRSVAPQVTPNLSAPAVSKPVAAGMKYVQVGMFGVPENATRSIARLSQMGFPVSSQVLHRNGKSYKIVLAGPFARPEQTMSALAQVRGAGYGDAYARK